MIGGGFFGSFGDIQRLRAAQGSDASAGATTVDSILLPTLTALDSLLVVASLESVAQATAQVTLHNVADNVTLGGISQAPIAAGGACIIDGILRQKKNSNVTVFMAAFGWDMGGGVALSLGRNNGVTTTWPGPWTLGLRHGGVTAGGTFHWSWAVYLMRGQ